MSGIPDIDKMDMLEMANTMALLKIPFTGLKTMEDMKERVKVTLQWSEKKSGWTAKEVRTLQYRFKFSVQRRNYANHILKFSHELLSALSMLI